MKRIVAYLLVMVGVGLVLPKAHSQEFEGAITGGAITSQIAGDELSGFTQWGGFLGPKVTYPLEEDLSLGVQLLYTHKGSRRDKDERLRGDGPWFKARFDYIDVPWFLAYPINENFSVHTGLYGSILINTASPNVNVSVDEFKRFDVGGLVGGTYHISDRWGLFVRFSHSILPFNKKSSKPIFAWRANGLFNSNIFFGIDYSLGR